MSPLEAFYNNSKVLITGGNGFIGKVLVEKLLRCFNIFKIYLLIRVKNGEDVQARMKCFLEENIFDYLRTKNPNALKKIIPIEVDYNFEDLNLKNNQLSLIHIEVEIVFNVVASIRFDEPLKDAIQINYLGTKRVVKLVRGIKNLKAFMHVSTFYSNCNQEIIDEKIYDHAIPYQQFIQMADILDRVSDDKKLKDMLYQNLPNTYTLTKHFGEKIVFNETQMPCGIFRPPIVSSSYKDSPGYVDNINGIIRVVVGIHLGLVHVIFCDPSKPSLISPVDYCINALITSAWDVNLNFKTRKDIPIYNYVFNENNLTWGEMRDLLPLGFHQPLENCQCFFLHTIPACLMDLMRVLFGKKIKYFRMFKKLEDTSITLSHFSTREWKVGNKNVLSMIEKTKNFQNRLEIDMRNVDWKEYYKTFIPGIKKYYFKENMENAERFAVKYQRLRWAHFIFKYFFYSILIILLCKILEIIL